MTYRFTIHVVPPSKKNSEKIISIGGRPRLAASSQYEAATVVAVHQLMEQRRIGGNSALFPLDGWLHAKLTFHILYCSDAANAPDLHNLYHAPLDWMQPPVMHKKTGNVKTPGAGIIANDRLVASLDGSRRVFECDNCPDRAKGCNHRFDPVLYASGKRKGEPRFKRDGVTPMKIKVQVCQKAKIEIELTEMEEANGK